MSFFLRDLAAGSRGFANFVVGLQFWELGVGRSGQDVNREEREELRAPGKNAKTFT